MADQRPNPDHRAAEEAALGPIRPPAPLDWDEIAAQADRVMTITDGRLTGGGDDGHH